MNNEVKISKEEILAQLKKEGVTNLDEFSSFLLKKTSKDGKEGAPIVASAIIYGHGFVSH